jgi:hypothetical protein
MTAVILSAWLYLFPAAACGVPGVSAAEIAPMPRAVPLLLRTPETWGPRVVVPPGKGK